MRLPWRRRPKASKATVDDPPRRIGLQMVGGVEAEIAAPWIAFRLAMARGEVVTVLGHNGDQLAVVTWNVAFARPVPDGNG